MQELRAPFISVITNCCNGEKYLAEAVKSVIAQTFTDWELILWDNLSTDRTAEIFAGFRDDRLKYFRAEKHAPLGEARNLAVARASGAWIAFLDSDDIWRPNHLGDHVAIAREGPPDLGLIYGRAELLVEDVSPSEARNRPTLKTGDLLPSVARWKDLPEGNILPKLVTHNFIPFVGATVSRKAFTRVGGFNPAYRHAEDYDLFIRIAQVAKALVASRASALYRMHTTNLSHVQCDLSVVETLDILRKVPSSRAQRTGLRAAHTTAALRLFERRHWLEALRVLLIKGSVFHLAKGLYRATSVRARLLLSSGWSFALRTWRR